ncbi:site-specific DNA-methyltransferase [Flavobacterium sp. CHNK8]|uniref:DNA-methyltransferase n=1 Tax=Flavobacterium sp. CHNK8 TaxID=2871165 RepID=UPI001C8D876B|nr:site-specific DNA-methyltransferase [Flavobacterium sp. CHNK8]QZK91573.1 site-specific DNA-methyltransferase [Flavobacterium sp. CHNK8]
MEINKIYLGNCIETIKEIKSDSVDLVYFDPPFFTQKKHSLVTRDSSKKYEFSDSWESLEEYIHLIELCLIQSKRILKKSGSVFLHCDKIASHYIRVVLDKVFGMENFQSEIIWSYKRWSNSKKGLLNSHQNIYFYSKSNKFKFNTYFTDYSATTNIDQILQDREKTSKGKTVYKTDIEGNPVIGKEKKGVPLSDTWEIPYLNPKARERVGYPTQKPVLLLKEIIKIVTDEGDLVVDPFCGSGTTCVAAKDMNRNFIGIDVSNDAVELANRRLEEMIITTSNLLKRGVDSYFEKADNDIALLKSIDAFPVQRNSGIDGFLKNHYEAKPVPVKIQGDLESLNDAIKKLENACTGKDYKLKIVVQTKKEIYNDRSFEYVSDVKILKSDRLKIQELYDKEINVNDNF